MVKRFLISCGIAFAALAAKATPDDSIKVVKGQVSDYYITVTQDRIVKGHVLDTNRQPLAGATVMFFASPMHNTTCPRRQLCHQRSEERRAPVCLLSREKDSEQNPGTG